MFEYLSLYDNDNDKGNDNNNDDGNDDDINDNKYLTFLHSSVLFPLSSHFPPAVARIATTLTCVSYTYDALVWFAIRICDLLSPSCYHAKLGRRNARSD